MTDQPAKIKKSITVIGGGIVGDVDEKLRAARVRGASVGHRERARRVGVL